MRVTKPFLVLAAIFVARSAYAVRKPADWESKIEALKELIGEVDGEWTKYHSSILEYMNNLKESNRGLYSVHYRDHFGIRAGILFAVNRIPKYEGIDFELAKDVEAEYHIRSMDQDLYEMQKMKRFFPNTDRRLFYSANHAKANALE